MLNYLQNIKNTDKTITTNTKKKSHKSIMIRIIELSHTPLQVLWIIMSIYRPILTKNQFN